MSLSFSKLTSAHRALLCTWLTSSLTVFRWQGLQLWGKRGPLPVLLLHDIDVGPWLLPGLMPGFKDYKGLIFNFIVQIITEAHSMFAEWRQERLVAWNHFQDALCLGVAALCLYPEKPTCGLYWEHLAFLHVCLWRMDEGLTDVYCIHINNSKASDLWKWQSLLWVQVLLTNDWPLAKASVWIV